MSGGIEVIGSGLRINDTETFGVSGVEVDPQGRRYVWNDPKATCHSGSTDHRVSLHQIWRHVMERTRENDAPSTLSAEKLHGLNPYRALADALKAHVSQQKVEGHIALAVDNATTEAAQDHILTEAAHAGMTNMTLLWRPVAACLHWLDLIEKHPTADISEGTKVLFVDLDSLRPECCVLEMKRWDNNGKIVPKRTRFRWENDMLLDEPLAYQAREAIFAAAAHSTTAGDAIPWDAGPFAGDLASFIHHGEPDGTLYCNALAYHWHTFNNGMIDEALKDAGIIQNVADIVQRVQQYAKTNNISHILWIGWLAHELKSSLPESHKCLENNSVVHGCQLYAHALENGLPTYYDKLPGLYILSEEQKYGTKSFNELVNNQKDVAGGQTWHLDAPITKFAVKEGISDFSAYLKHDDWDKIRISTTSLPIPVTQQTDVVLQCEMKPAQGRALVTILPKDQATHVFGDRGNILLNWDEMEDSDLELFVAPNVYPVIGRLKDDPEYEDIFNAFISDGSMDFYSDVNYRGHEVGFWKLMEPWGTKPPWGYDHQWNGEPVRGMFGVGDSYLTQAQLDVFVGKMNALPQQPNADKIKFMNYLFDSVPAAFLEELRNKLKCSNPDFRANILTRNNSWWFKETWNWGYTAGRIIKTPEDFNLFMDFLINHSLKNGYPVHPATDFAPIYFWSFFRCLCYRKAVVDSDEGKALRILKIIDTFARADFPGINFKGIANARKFVLCAILFSLRFRSRNAAFLQPGSGPLYDAIDQCVEGVVPPVSTAGMIPAELGIANLNQFVLKFLRQTATRQDMEALDGLVTSMS